MKDFDLEFRLGYDGEAAGDKVHLFAGGRKADAELKLDDSQLETYRDAIEAGGCTKDIVAEMGCLLWSALMAGDVGKLFEDLRGENGPETRFCLYLRIEDYLGSEKLERMPWEALYEENTDGGAKFLARNSGFSIARTPFGRDPEPVAPPPLAGSLKVLVVIPKGSGLANVEREFKNIEAALVAARLTPVLEKLSGDVTPARLRAKIGSQSWDVFHFIGHGRTKARSSAEEAMNPGDPVPLHTEVCLNDDAGGEQWMDGGDLADLFKGTGLRLAVLSCCLAGAAVTGRKLSGLGPAFLNIGARAVVAMRYPIGDGYANDFTMEFYAKLFNGKEPGRVDLAVECAREALYYDRSGDDGRPFITPVLFLAGDPRIFDLSERAVAVEPLAPPSAPAAEVRASLPEPLVKALAEGRLVPVIGPRVLTAEAARTGPPIPDAGQVARALADQFKYPRMEDFELAEAGDWMDSLLLQWVCQCFQNQRWDLAEAVAGIYEDAEPPALLGRIAEWNIPGAFYLHFDKLLAGAFRARDRKFRMVDGVKRSVSPGEYPLLINVKGSIRDHGSLVLTEAEHGRLWDDLAAMEPDVLNLVRGYSGQSSRSLFFLGVSPRDPLVKRLFSKLAENWAGVLQEGSVFFLCRAGEGRDPYWDPFKVAWIEDDLEDVVNRLTALQPGGAR